LKIVEETPDRMVLVTSPVARHLGVVLTAVSGGLLVWVLGSVAAGRWTWQTTIRDAEGGSGFPVWVGLLLTLFFLALGLIALFGSATATYTLERPTRKLHMVMRRLGRVPEYQMLSFDHVRDVLVREESEGGAWCVRLVLPPPYDFEPPEVYTAAREQHEATAHRILRFLDRV